MKTIHAILLITLLNVFIIINANENPKEEVSTHSTEKLTTMLSVEAQHKQIKQHHFATLQEIDDTYHEVKKIIIPIKQELQHYLLK